MINRKSHMPFRLVPKTNDLGWPWTADTHSVPEKMRISEFTTKIWMKIDPHYQQQKCRPMTPVSGSIRFCKYSWRFPREGTSNDSGVVDNSNFQHFCSLFFGYFRDEASSITWRYAVCCPLFSDHKMHDFEWLFRIKFCFCTTLAGWDCATFEK